MDVKLTENQPQFIGNNTYIPSVASMRKAIINKTDYDDTDFKNPVPQGLNSIMVLCVEDDILTMANGKNFLTGNHPVETFLPILHFEKAGFDIEFYTLRGRPAKFELWALPDDDKNIMDAYKRYMAQLENPKSLSEFVKTYRGEAVPYEAIFIPGGHGAVITLPHSDVVGEALRKFFYEEKFILSLCHGPASFISASLDIKGDQYIFDDYEVVSFPDSADDATVKFGYLPGKMPWHFNAKLEQLGVNVVNHRYTGQVHVDRKLITGDGPKAGNEFGKISAQMMLDRIHAAAARRPVHGLF